MGAAEIIPAGADTARTAAVQLYRVRVLAPMLTALQTVDRRIANHPELRGLAGPNSVCVSADEAEIARSLAASVRAANGTDIEEAMLLRLHELRAAFFAPLIAGTWQAYGLRFDDPSRRRHLIHPDWWGDRAMQYRPNVGELISQGPRPLGGEHREIEIATDAVADLPSAED